MSNWDIINKTWEQIKCLARMGFQAWLQALCSSNQTIHFLVGGNTYKTLHYAHGWSCDIQTYPAAPYTQLPWSRNCYDFKSYKLVPLTLLCSTTMVWANSWFTVLAQICTPMLSNPMLDSLESSLSWSSIIIKNLHFLTILWHRLWKLLCRKPSLHIHLSSSPPLLLSPLPSVPRVYPQKSETQKMFMCKDWNQIS